MTDDQHRARELLAQAYEAAGGWVAESAADVRGGYPGRHDLAAIEAITAALRAAPEGFVMVPVDSVLPCGCGCYRVCCRSCGTELDGFDDARPQVQP